jgi:hypothetical protein
VGSSVGLGVGLLDGFFDGLPDSFIRKKKLDVIGEIIYDKFGLL